MTRDDDTGSSVGPGDDRVQIRDVTPRDGLQSERPVAPDVRARLAARLAACGVADVEAAAFVSPRAVPAMADAESVMAALPIDGPTNWWALVPNAPGASFALAAGCRHLTVTVSVSDGYSRKNVGRGADESVAALGAIGDVVDTRSGETTIALDVVLSCAFGSPFHDVADAASVTRVAAAVAATLPAARITLADTTGTATPRRIREVVRAVTVATGRVPGLHLHDTRGTALVNALAGLDEGVRRFDTATGGLGGSPFAPGAGGNLPTEQFVLMLEDLGVPTGIDLDELLSIAAGLPEIVGHDIASRVAVAGPLPDFGSRG